MSLPVQNARFLPLYPYSTVALLRDLQNGLRYSLASQNYTLAWETTFQELEGLSFVHRTVHDRFSWPVYRFEVPLVLGILEISGLQVNIPDPEHQPNWRLDVPLDHLLFEVRLEGNGPQNYWQMKAYFSAALGEPLTCWERDDQLHAEWNSDGLIITITYWFKSTSSPGESGFASLTIINERIFPQYFSDTDQESFSLDQQGLIFQTFDLPHVSIPHNYRSSYWVRFSPEAVREKLKTGNKSLAVWYDPQHRKLGLAKDELLGLIVDLKNDQQFTLQRLDHDRGHYSDEIQVMGPGARKETLLSGEVGELQPVVGMLEELGIAVESRS